MSPQFSNRAALGWLGVALLVTFVGLRAANRDSHVDDDWQAIDGVRYSDGVSGHNHLNNEPDLPPGQGLFAIPLDGTSEQFEKGHRIDVMYQEEADTSALLIVQDVPVHSTYRPCGQSFPKVELLLAQDDVDRLQALRDDGGKLTLVRHTKPASEE